MKNLNEKELKELNGGNVPAAAYMTDGEIQGLGECLDYAGSYVVGFFSGLWG